MSSIKKKHEGSPCKKTCIENQDNKEQREKMFASNFKKKYFIFLHG